MWELLCSGVFEAATIHYAVAKIFGPLLFGRGWCGYANDPEATTVFLHADKDCRIKRVMERDGINEKKAAKLIKEVDEKRASFHKFCTGKEWEDANQYQLSIDTGKLDISDAADMIINYINAKNIGQKHL